MQTLRIKKQKAGDPPEEEQGGEPEAESTEPTSVEFATKTELEEVKAGLGEVKQSMETMTSEFTTVGESVSALVESLKGSEKTPAEKKEMAERQLADVTEIEEKQRRNRPIPIFGDNTVKVGEDFLIKGVTPEVPYEEAQRNFYKALKSPTDDANLIEFQTRCDRMKLKCQMLNKKPYELKEYREWQSFLEKTGYDEIVKLVTTSTTTDFVPEGWSNQIERYYYLALKATMLFSEFTMPHNPFRWDILGRPTAHRRAEPATNQRGTAGDEITASNPAQGVVTFDAEVLTVRVDLTEEFVEDSVDMYWEVLANEMLPEGLAEGMESAVLNGDTRTATNHQDDTGKTATDPETAWDGLRRHALRRSATVDNEASSGAFDYGRLTEMINAGGKYLINASETAWVVDTQNYTKILGFDEVKTIDNFGQMATNVQGAVMMLMGRPVVVSEHIALANDSGVVSATTADNTHGTLLLVNTKQFRIGNIPREGATQVLFDGLTRGYYFTLTCRKDFQAMQPHVAGYTPAAMSIKG